MNSPKAVCAISSGAPRLADISERVCDSASLIAPVQALVGRPKSGRRQLKEVTVRVTEINAMSAA
jgi:hypothetical protein